MLVFHRKYFLATILLFLTEAYIALFVQDQFIRPYLGDFLVVIFLYCLLSSFWKTNPGVKAVSVLLFAFLIEMLQYFNFAELLGLQENEIASVVLGRHFDWKDILLYSIGIITVYTLEKVRKS